MNTTPTTPPPEANTAPDKDGKGVVLPRLVRFLKASIKRHCAACPKAPEMPKKPLKTLWHLSCALAAWVPLRVLDAIFKLPKHDSKPD
jgi:hypothetical protein